MFFSCVTAGLVLIFSLKLYKFLKQHTRMVQLSKQFAVPKTSMLLGNAHSLLGIPAHEVINKVLDMMAECGKVMGFWFGPFIFVIFMMDIGSTELVLGSQKLLTKAHEYGLLQNWLREGLLISRPAKWFKRRKILTAAFHFSILNQFVEIFDRNSRIFVHNLQTSNRRDPIINIGHWINLATLDVICVGILVLVVTFFAKFGSFFKRLKRVRHLSHQFIIPKTVPVLGNAHMLISIQPERIIYAIRDIIEEYGKTVGFWFGPFIFGVFMMDIKYAECVLSSQTLLVKSMEYDFLQNWLCEGLLISRPPKWFKRRKTLTPAFHFNILEQYIEIFDRNAHILVANLLKEAKNKNDIVNMDHWLNLVTLDIICGEILVV